MSLCVGQVVVPLHFLPKFVFIGGVSIGVVLACLSVGILVTAAALITMYMRQIVSLKSLLNPTPTLTLTPAEPTPHLCHSVLLKNLQLGLENEGRDTGL